MSDVPEAKTSVTKRIEFDAGHRIPSHNSKCRNFHGHRYAVEATLEGPVKPVRGLTDDGMVLDFSYIKRVMMEKIHDPWDHAFLVFEGDELGRQALMIMNRERDDTNPHKTVVLSVVPTAENLAQLAFEILDHEFAKIFGTDLQLTQIRVYETPTGFADVRRVR